jgi:aldose 1-epimerase
VKKNRLVCAVATLGALTFLGIGAAPAATAVRSVFGHMPDGRPVYAVTLHNAHGITVRLITYGARVQSIITPDRNGHLTDVALGYANLAGYLSKGDAYFGASVGRYANRIANGRFTLDGHKYQLTINDGPNSLHGGLIGFDRHIWHITAIHQGRNASVTMRLISPNGDQGYPGRLTVTATYSLNDNNRLRIHYRATTNAPTIVNISNHTYWNLSGEGSGSILNERIMIAGREMTPVNATQIPTGKIVSVIGTPYDFLKLKTIGRDIRDGHSRQLVIGRGYDMNWVISRKAVARPRLVARVVDPASGREIELYSTQPGLQFYTGNYLNGTVVGTSGHIYRQSDGFVLEPQRFPDAPNHPNFGSAVLRPGQLYQNIIVYRFLTVGGH